MQVDNTKLYFSLPCGVGQLKISFDAAATLARDVCLETPGVAGMVSSERPEDGWYSTNGVMLTEEEQAGCCRVRLYIAVKSGEPVTDTAKAVQQKVKESIESSLGLSAAAVDVFVGAISIPKQ